MTMPAGHPVRMHRRGDRHDLRSRHGVRVPIPIKHVRGRAIHEVRRRIDVEPEIRASAPVVGRRHRRPAHVSIARITRLPGHPRGRVSPSRDPHPAARVGVHPPAVVEHDPAERIVVVADPKPVVVRVELPVAGCLVRREIRTDPIGRGHPHRAVGGVFFPAAIRGQHIVEVGQRRGVRVLVLRRRRRRRLGDLGRLGLARAREPTARSLRADRSSNRGVRWGDTAAHRHGRASEERGRKREPRQGSSSGRGHQA